MNDRDNRIVSMEFDNSNFERNVKTSMSTIDKLNEKLEFKGAGDGLANLEKMSGKVDFSALQNSIQNIEKAFTPMGMAFYTVWTDVIRQVEGKINEFNKLVFQDPYKDGFKEYELKMGSVQTIMNGSGKSLEEVNKYLDELNAYSDRTIYSFSDMTSNIGKFVNAGVDLEDAVVAIKGISNEAALAGASATQASHAMYNFSQALSSGSIKWIDWMSIKNATMDTKEFKEELLKTAASLGTVARVGDRFLPVLDGAVASEDKAFDAIKGFNDSLKEEWLTSDVLIQTLKRYTDETTDLGQRAYAAATEVKTFSMMMDTLKESMGSGWSQTFELIIGDFNEAKDVFTKVTAIFDGIISRTATIRNNIIKLWDTSGGREKVLNTIYSGLDKIESKYNSFLKMVLGENYDKLIGDLNEELGNTSDAIQEITDKEKAFAWEVWNLNNHGSGAERRRQAEELGLSYENVQKYLDGIISGSNKWTEYQESLNKTTEDIKENIEEAKESIEDISNGKVSKFVSDILNVAKNIGKSVVNIGAGLSNIASIFLNSLIKNMDYDKISGGFLDFSEVILNLSERFRKWTENNKTLEKTFEQVFGVINDIIPIIGKVYRGVISFISYIWNSIPAIREGISNAIDNIANNEELIKFWNNVKNVFKTVWTVIKNIGNTILVSFGSDPINSVADAFERIRDAAKKLLDGTLGLINRLFSGTAKEANKSGDTLAKAADKTSEGSKALTILKDILVSLFNFGKKLIIAVGPAIVSFIDALGDRLSSLSFDDILHVIKEGGLIALLNYIIGIVKNFGDIEGGITDLIKGVGESISDAINTSFGNDTETKLKKIAVSIGLIAASIFALSLLNPDRLRNTIVLLSSVLIILIGLSAILSKNINSKESTEGVKGVGTFANIFTSILENLGNSLKKVGVASVITAFVIAIMAIIGSMKLLDSVNINGFDERWAALMVTFGLIVGSLIGLLMIAKKAEGSITTYLGISAVIGAVSKAILTIALSLYALNVIMEKSEYGPLSLIMTTSMLSLIVFLMSKMVEACENIDSSYGKLRGITKIINALGNVLLKISLSLALLSLLPLNENITNMFMVILIVSTMGVLIDHLSKLSYTDKVFNNVIKIMKAISNMILIISLSMALLGNNSVENNIIIFIGMIALIEALLWTISKMPNNVSEFNNIKKVCKTITSLLLDITATALIIGLINKQVDVNDMMGVLVTIGGIGAIAIGMAYFVKQFNINKNVTKSLNSLMTSVLAMSLVFSLITKSVGTYGADAASQGVLALLMMLSGLLIVMKMMTLIPTDIAGVGALLVLSVGLTAISGALAILSKQNMEKVYASLGAIAIVFAAFILSLYAITPLLPVIGGLTASLFGLSIVVYKLSKAFFIGTLGMYLVIKALKILNEMYDKGETSTKSFAKVLGDALQTIYDAAGLIAQVGLKILQEFIKGLVAALPDFVDAIGTLILTLVKCLDKWVYPIAKSLVLLLLSVLNTVILIIGEEGSTLVQIIENLVWAIAEIIDNALADFLEGFNVGGVLDGVIGSLRDGADWFHETIKSTSSQISKDINSLSDEYSVDVDAIFDVNSIFKGGLDSGFGLQDQLDKLKADYSTKDITDAMMNDKDFADLDMSKYMSIDISEYEDKFNAMGSINANSYVNAFDSVDGYPDGYNLSEEALDGMYDNLPEFETVADEEANTLSDQFVASSPQTYEEGQLMSRDGAEGIESQDWRYKSAAGTVVGAFTAGLSEKAGDMWESGRHMARSLLEGFDGYLYMENESNGNLFYDRGKLVGQRLVDGLSDASNSVNEESYNIAKDIKTGITNELEDIEPVIHASVEVESFGDRLPEDATFVEKILAADFGMNHKFYSPSSEELSNWANKYKNNNQEVNLSDKSMSEIVTMMQNQLGNMNGNVYLDSGAIVGELVGDINDALGVLTRRNSVGQRSTATRIK